MIMQGNAAQDVVSITNQTVTGDRIGVATALYRLAANGQIQTEQNGSPPASAANWLTPPFAMGNYECRATDAGTVGTGTFVGTLNTWQVLSTDRAWSMQRNLGAGQCTKTLTIEIRRAADAVVLDTATITLTAIWDV